VIADPIIQHYLWRWAAAIAAQVERIKAGHETGAYSRGDFYSGAGDGWSDCVLLLESLTQFHRWYDHAALRWPSIGKLPRLDTSLRAGVADLRKMTIHADDFVRGDGRGTAQSRFVAETPFGHAATTYQIADGVLIFGGRLPLLDAAVDALNCAKCLSENGFLRKG
jgi:hypothetical protein